MTTSDGIGSADIQSSERRKADVLVKHLDFVALAHQVYESRDFAPMPILADALTDAGCDSTDILNHCRGEGVHVRGCWAVDLVLGKD